MYALTVCAGSEGSDESAHKHRLVWAFATRVCDKHQSFMRWLIYGLCGIPQSHRFHITYGRVLLGKTRILIL